MTKRLQNIYKEFFGQPYFWFLFYDFEEAKFTDGRKPWPAALLLHITITSNPGYAFSHLFLQNLIYDYLIHL